MTFSGTPQKCHSSKILPATHIIYSLTPAHKHHLLPTNTQPARHTITRDVPSLIEILAKTKTLASNKMCSRMASIRLFKALPSVHTKGFGLRQFAGSPIPTDPAVHAVDDNLDDDLDIASAKTEGNPNRGQHGQHQHQQVLERNMPLSSPKLVTTPVGQPINPKMHQKRRTSTVPLDQITCVGIDGYPTSPDGVDSGREGRERDRKEQELDDKEYFKHRKASPLSEIQIADTRKPVTRATDGTADSKYNSGGDGVITWLPEQLVSADETLRRASEIFKQNAMRGDPDSPHGRRLRELRGEWW